jgi:membrane protein DedA with SNARE-associated domain
MFEWITGLVERGSYWGIALLMLLENVFPPIPSELIMPLAGFTAARGDLSLLGVIVAGSIGSLAGALLWYGIGRWLGLDRLKGFAARHGRWLTLSPEDLDQAQGFFTRHGGKAVLLGRLVPGVRTLISVPAGIVGMPLPSFLLWTGIGTVVWTALLAGAGYLLESQYEAVSAWLGPVSNVIVGAIVVFYLYRVVTFRPRGARRAEGA